MHNPYSLITTLFPIISTFKLYLIDLQIQPNLTITKTIGIFSLNILKLVSNSNNLSLFLLYAFGIAN